MVPGAEKARDKWEEVRAERGQHSMQGFEGFGEDLGFYPEGGRSLGGPEQRGHVT